MDIPDTYQNFKIGSFLKVSWSLKSETYSNFVLLRKIYLIYLQFEWTCTHMTVTSIAIRKRLFHRITQFFKILTSYAVFNIFLVNWSHPKNLLSVGKLSSSWWWIQIFQNSNFHLKAEILSLAKVLSVVFLKWWAYFIRFKENAC